MGDNEQDGASAARKRAIASTQSRRCPLRFNDKELRDTVVAKESSASTTAINPRWIGRQQSKL